MNFPGFLKRGDRFDKAFEDLQSDVMNALSEELVSSAESDADLSDGSSEGEKLDLADAGESGDPVEDRVYLAETPEPESVKRLSTHAQTRLAALASFDELHRHAESQLQTIGDLLADIVTSQHLTRDFLNGISPEIHRTNELELSHSALSADNRNLTEQLQDARKKLQEQENTIDTLQRRDLGAQQDKDALRVALSAAKLENVEMSNALARVEAERGDLAKSLATRTVEAEKRLRENEVLREKHVNLSIDLDKSHKREAEARRKYDEIAAIHASETSHYTETLSALARSEKEVFRLQKSLEASQAKQAELADAVRTLEADSDSETKQRIAEVGGLRAEIQSLQSRLESAAAEATDAAREIADLRQKLTEADSEKQILEKQVALLRDENDSDRRNLSAANLNLSELNLRQTSGTVDLERHRHESEELRAEIAELAAEVKKLRPYERLYRAEKARSRNSARPSPATDAIGSQANNANQVHSASAGA